MSEEEIISPPSCTQLLDTNNNINNKRLELFQAQHTQFHIDPSLAKRCHESSSDAIPLLLHGSRSTKLIIGRGHDATIKIGKANKRVSRHHALIEHKPHLNGFEMTVLSPNGALIDHIIFDQGEHVPIMEGTIIEIVGYKLLFNGVKEEEVEQQVIIPMEEDIVEEHQEKLKVEEEEIVEAMDTDTVTTPVTTTTTAAAAAAASETMIKESTSISTSSVITTTTTNQQIKSTSSKIKKATRNVVSKRPMTLEDEIIQVLVYTRKSTMTCTDISNRLQGQSYNSVAKILNGTPVIGCVKRLGKTADGSPKENLYYYKPDLDPDQERRKKYSDVGRSARKCTMKDTQYFFRIPPKLPAHKASSKIRKRTTNHAKELQEEDEELGSNNSSDDASDMEVFELFKDV